MKMDRNGIEKVLQTYFDASFEYDAGKTDMALRPEAHVCGMSAGSPAFTDTPKAQFLDLVRTLKKDGAVTREWRDEIHSIEFLSVALGV